LRNAQAMADPGIRGVSAAYWFPPKDWPLRPVQTVSFFFIYHKDVIYTVSIGSDTVGNAVSTDF